MHYHARAVVVNLDKMGETSALCNILQMFIHGICSKYILTISWHHPSSGDATSFVIKFNIRWDKIKTYRIRTNLHIKYAVKTTSFNCAYVQQILFCIDIFCLLRKRIMTDLHTVWISMEFGPDGHIFVNLVDQRPAIFVIINDAITSPAVFLFQHNEDCQLCWKTRTYSSIRNWL